MAQGGVIFVYVLTTLITRGGSLPMTSYELDEFVASCRWKTFVRIPPPFNSEDFRY